MFDVGEGVQPGLGPDRCQGLYGHSLRVDET